MSANSNGLLFGMIEKETITTLTQNLSDFLMIFSPIIGYLAQGIKFQRTHSSEGFSKYMCLLLIFANLLRIFFWIGKQFTVILLYQSCIVILSQFYLIHMSLKYDTTNPSNLLPITTIISKETEKISKSNFVSLFSFNQTFNNEFVPRVLKETGKPRKQSSLNDLTYVQFNESGVVPRIDPKTGIISIIPDWSKN